MSVPSEPEGFRDFVHTQSPRLLRTAWLLTGGDLAHAEDLVQIALARTWPRFERLVRNGDPTAYVRRVLINAHRQAWRKHARHEVLRAEGVDRADAFDAFDALDERERISGALAALPRRQRAVIVLRFVEDLSEAETADLLHCTVGTVKSQTAKARIALRRSLGDGPLTIDRSSSD